MPSYKFFTLQNRSKKESYGINIKREMVPSNKSELLSTVLELNPNPVFYKTTEGIYLYCNTAFCVYIGLDKSNIVGRTVYEVNPKELAEIYDEQDRNIIKSKCKQTYKTKSKFKDGSYHDILISKAADIDSSGKPRGIVGSITDISELVNYESKMNRLLRLKQALLEINRIIIEKNDIIEICNLVLEKVSIAMENADIGCVLLLDKENNLRIIASKGYDKEQCKKFSIKLQESFHYLKTKGKIDAPVIINNIQKFDWKRYTDYWKRTQEETGPAFLIDENEEVDWIDYSKVLESSEEIQLESSISTPIIFDGQLFGFINIDSTHNYAFDETDLEVMEYIKNQIEIGLSKYKLYEQMTYLSRYDKLTNIYNRGYFEELFDASINEALKNNEEFILIMFDFNGLKTINDTYGHLGGDELIKKFALYLTSILNEKDYLGRLGGDEFAAVIYDIKINELCEKIENINNDFKENPVIFDDNTIVGSFSYGISKFPEDGIDYNSLFKRADKKMYEYKQKIR